MCVCVCVCVCVCAAKAGLVGLGKTVSQEGSRYNICCNIVAPSAWSRLSKDVMPPGQNTACSNARLSNLNMLAETMID